MIYEKYKNKRVIIVGLLTLGAIVLGYFAIPQTSTYDTNAEVKPTGMNSSEGNTIMPEIDTRAAALRVL
jgi:hypothetical protein